MSKGQANRLSAQQIQGGGPRAIFGAIATVHDGGVADASEATYEALRAAYPELKFRLRWSLPKSEINDALSSIDARLGQTLFVKNAKIKPDGGLIEVQDNSERWRVVLVSEAKYQGKDIENIEAGLQVGVGGDQDLMVAGNAIERVHKNINEIRNLMLRELYFPYVVFLQGSNFATSTFEVFRPDGRAIVIPHDRGSMNRIDRVTAANYCMAINENHCENIIVEGDGNDLMLQAASLYCQSHAWSPEEMGGIMVTIAETSLSILGKDLSFD